MTRLACLLLCALALHSDAAKASITNRRQYWPDPGLTARSPQECIEASFTNPTWGIYDPALVAVNSSSGGTQGDVRFLTVNSATGVSANCTAKDIDLDPKGASALNVWHNCSIAGLFFQFNLESLDMRLKGSWRCENSSSLVFAANGSWEVPLIQGCLDEWNTPRGQETLCIMGNSQVPAGLSSPVAIHPQLPILPYTPSERAQRCVDRSYDPEWEIDGFFYQHHYVEGNNKTAMSYDLSLNVTNISDGESIQCAVRFDRDGNPKTGSAAWTGCAGTGNTGSYTNGTSLEVMLDTDYGIFGLRQAWKCSDGVAGVEREQFNGVAYTNISLACGNPLNLAVYGNNGSVVGATSDYNCSLSTLPLAFTGYVDSAPPMPHTYYTQSCTIESITHTTAMALREYQIESTPVQGQVNTTSVVGSFKLYNPGSRDTYQLYRMPVLDDGRWHECTAGSQALPWQLAGCKYMLNRGSHRLGFQVQWYCDDRDPSNAVLFNATVEEQLPAEVCGILDGRNVCGLPVDAAELPLSVSSLTWASSGGPMQRGPTLPWI